jgi:hypothetical protein
MKKMVGLALKGGLKYYTRLVCLNAKPKNFFTTKKKGLRKMSKRKKSLGFYSIFSL